MGNTICIVSTGVANLASIRAAFERLGMTAANAVLPDDVRDAEFAVLPGVGAFGAGMEALRKQEFTEALKERVAADKPLLAVCLGMQLLCSESEETPGVEGLGIVSAGVERFRTELPVPQFGWNKVTPEAGAKWMQEGFAYFANSFRIASECPGWERATAEYDETFAAALRKGNILACQFHPELSGSWGLELLKNWMNGFGL